MEKLMYAALATIAIAIAITMQYAIGAPDTTDAATLYVRAADAAQVDSPSSTNLDFPGRPPYGPAWMRIAKEAWDANGAARKLAHEARSQGKAQWPDANDNALLNKLRRLSNDLSDASLYQETQADHAAAIELVRDDLGLADLLQEKPSKSLLRVLVSSGIAFQATNRLLIITSDIALTRDEKDAKAVHVLVAKALIAQLLDQRLPEAQLTEILGPKGAAAWKDPNFPPERVIETLNRANGERTLAAMSLSCHVFRFDKGCWPASLDELVPDYLPRAPIDPWGDGKKTFGYALIKAGLPDGTDRPLVYSRCLSPDGLQYRIDEPQYGFSTGFTVETQAGPRRKQTGQFRDVSRWMLAPGAAGAGATARPLK